MVTRRDFLRGTMGGLVGTLLPRKSYASCGGLALEFSVQQVKGDPISTAFYKGNLRQRKRIIDEIAMPAQELFGLAGVPVTVHSFNDYACSMFVRGERIPVMYGRDEQFLNDKYPTIEDLFHLLSLAYENRELVAYARAQYIAAEDPVHFETELRAQILEELLEKLDGVTDRQRKQIGLFSGRWEKIQKDFPRKESLFIYEHMYGHVLAHELGHICGLKHAERKEGEKETLLPSGDENIMAKGDELDLSYFLDMKYNFSEEDKKKIGAALCEQK